MQSYLNTKLILFREILKNTTIISDKDIMPFSFLEKISKKFKTLDISEECEKIRNILFKPANDFKIKNLAMDKVLKLCGLKKN